MPFPYGLLGIGPDSDTDDDHGDEVFKRSPPKRFTIVGLFRVLLLIALVSLAVLAIQMRCPCEGESELKTPARQENPPERKRNKEPKSNAIALERESNAGSANENPNSKDKLEESKEPRPLILYWTRFFGRSNLSVHVRDFPECRYKCAYSGDRSRIRDARAIILHARDTNVRDLPPFRRDQLRVFLNMEAPYLTWLPSRASLPDDFFNLTMTYRSSCALFHPYGEFRPLDGSEKSSELWNQSEIDALIERKDKVAYYAISHCETPSKRESYLERLSAHMNITKLGGCAIDAKCKDSACLKRLTGKAGRMSKKWKHEDFLKQQSEEHFFVFAFENGVCAEYTTEKFFRLFQLVVPVVLTRASMPDFVPQSAYVAASDFETPRDLADYLKRVASNRTEYRKFFDWTRHYRRAHSEFFHPDRDCRICEFLHTKKFQKQSVTSDYRKHMDASVCSQDFGKKLADGDFEWIRSEEERLRTIVRTAEPEAHWTRIGGSNEER